MGDIETDIKRFESLKLRKDKLEKKQIEIKLRLDNLREEYKKNIELLKTNFGVSSIEEAVALRDKMQQELNEQADKLEKSLDEFENKLKEIE